MIQPCPCGHSNCKSYIVPGLVRCACNSLTKEQALLIDAAGDLLAACEALEAFDQHASNCANCDEWGPGNCAEGGRIFSAAHRLIRAALDKAKPKATGETQ